MNLVLGGQAGRSVRLSDGTSGGERIPVPGMDSPLPPDAAGPLGPMPGVLRTPIPGKRE